MLISKEVEITLHSKTIKHYEKLGYNIPKHKDCNYRTTVPKGTKIKVRVEDLPPKSNVKVTLKCDNPNCKKEYKISYDTKAVLRTASNKTLPNEWANRKKKLF